MRLERFDDPDLAQYSYALVSDETSEAIVVDPRRDVDVYTRFAHDEEVTIATVFETHIHADFASGARELAECTGAELALSVYDEGEKYEVAFPHRELRDGDRVEVGEIAIEAVHTPGHTPEHLSFLVFETTRSTEVPELMLSGDFLFVGSLGRPDLIGEKAKMELAKQLFASVRDKLEGLPDGLEIHPGHGAGSMCGSGMGGRPMSTLAFERASNPYLDPDLDEEAFVERILGTVPFFPPYYLRMKDLNAEGPPILDGLPGREAIPAERFRELVEKGHVVIDLRDQLAFGGGHIPGALGIGLHGKLSTWSAWMVPYDRPLLLVTPDDATVEPAIRALVRVGHDSIVGHLDGGFQSWIDRGLPLETLEQMAPPELQRQLATRDDVRVLDVRTDDEWKSGHIERAIHVMGGEVEDRLDELPPKKTPLAVTCGSGYRSTVVASLLKRKGWKHVVNVTGGMEAWNRAGMPARSEAAEGRGDRVPKTPKG